MKRVGIIGFIHESNSFSPLPTRREHFEQASFTKGEAVIARWQNISHELGGFLEGAKTYEFLPVPLIATYAVPGGPIEPSAFTGLADETIEALERSLPLDGLLLSLHGAAFAEDFPDADGELARRIRLAVGPEIPIVMTLDLHANISPLMIASANATICYRSNPHLDQKARGREAAEVMARTLRGEITPVQALEKPPLIINISKQYTKQEPACGLYADVEAVLKWPGVVSASVAMGFYYADVEEMGASFVAVTDGDADLARKAARWMAERAWGRRQEFVGDLIGPSEAVRHASHAEKGPVVLLDVGDNVGGGSPADSTILFEEVLRQKAPRALVILFDPQAVAACVSAGVRSEVEVTVGGKTDQQHGTPLKVKGKVRMISDGLFTEPEVRHGGWGTYDQGVTSVLEMEQGHTIILTSARMPPMSLQQVLSLGIKPEEKKILIVKGVIAPRAAYEPIASMIIPVDTPGSTSMNPAAFKYQHRRRPLYPLEETAAYP